MCMALVLFITIRVWKIIMFECFKFFPMLCLFIFCIHVNEKRLNILNIGLDY